LQANTPLGEAGTPCNPGGPHDRMHRPPSGHPRPRPEPHATAFAASCVQFVNAVHHVAGIEQGRGGGTLRKIPMRRFLRLSNTDTPAARSTRSAVSARALGIRQGHAECSHRAIGQVGFPQEGTPAAGVASSPDAAPLANQQGRGRTGRARPPSGSTPFVSATGGSARARRSPRTAAAGSVSAGLGEVSASGHIVARSATRSRRDGQRNRLFGEDFGGI
jgi:hypothetical protein